MSSRDLIRVAFHEDSSHYRQMCRECWNEELCGFSMYTAPDFLHQTKIICTDEYWLPAWNFVVRQMQMDVDRMACNKCVPHVLNDYLAKFEERKRELAFWQQNHLWKPYFSAKRAERYLDLAQTGLKHTMMVIIQDMERWIHDYDIPKCLFIRHMQVAHEVLQAIFEEKHEHLVCMILTHLYMMENPAIHLYHIIPRRKRKQFNCVL